MGEAMRAGMPMPASMKMGGPSRRTVIVSSLLVFTGFAGGVAWSRGRRARLF
jgi:hypothetical protein